MESQQLMTPRKSVTPPSLNQTPSSDNPVLGLIARMASEGYATFGTQNKRPIKVGESWKSSVVDIVPESHNYPHGEYGIVLKSDDLVIDIDPRKFPDGRKIWTEFVNDFGVPSYISRARIIRTGSGGMHIYLRKPSEFKIRKGLREYPGLDFLSEGCYAIGVGSTIKNTGSYSFINDPTDTPIAPAEILNAIKREVVEDFTPKHEGFSDSESQQARYKEYLTAAAPAIAGQGGDVHTFKVACRGRDLNLSPEVTHKLMSEYFNLRCSPPWSEHELQRKVRNAYDYGKLPPGGLDPAVVLPKLEEEENDKWMSQLDLNSQKLYKHTLKNCVLLMSHDKNLKDKFMLNLFTGKVEMRDKMPWEKRRINHYREANDLEVGHIALYLAQTYHVEFPPPKIWDALAIVASDNTHHPIREYLNDLKWDGVPRLEGWLTYYCGAPSTPYTKAVGKKTLLGAVARVYQPGIKFDTVLVLEGEQGCGKSTTCSILGGKWYGDAPIDIHNQKDTIEYIRSHWIIEFSEMASTRKADVNSLKNFITRQEDDARPAYARARVRFPRQSIFIGTVNPDSVGYLADETGNRRFWPVLCTNFKLEELRKDRDQLFAEAVQCFKTGEALYLPANLFSVALLEAQRRQVKDPWVDIISEYVIDGAGKDKNTITTEEIYTTVIGGNYLTMNTGHSRRIAAALRGLGYTLIRGQHGNAYVKINTVGGS